MRAIFPIPNRCSLFEYLARWVWEEIIEYHSVGRPYYEVGFTGHLVKEIMKNVKAYPNVSLWANPGFKENEYGSDIDIFVETEINHFVWYALQAKVLISNGKYRKVEMDKGGGITQGDMLINLSKLSGCIGKYLFYNGVENFKHKGKDQCNKLFNEPQFGCSLVDITTVKEVVRKNKNPTFYDFHPDHAQPWRVLVCCQTPISKIKTFDLLQVEQGVKNYPASFGEKIETNEDTINEEDVDLNAINNFSENANWFPTYRMVIRTTESLSQLKRKKK